MSILDLHADVTSAAIPRYVKPPALTPTPTFSAWKLATSPLRGIGEAVSQVGASIAEVVAGYGDVMGRIESGQSLQDRQPDMQSDFADALRDRGRQFRPDPLTAHAAEQVLYGFARGASKVIGGTLVAGPGGAIAAGVEEGISTADDLAREGVDFPTRVKAGAVQGAGLALAALPLVGKTLPQTAALYLAGGPGGFMAQQALTREILRAGGYDGIAASYDPLDPVGLTVSALIPAAFTAAGIRAQRAPRRVPVDVEDAARVALQAEQRRSTNPETGPRAADQHETALTRAEDAMARGDEVSVTDVAPARVPVDALPPIRVAEAAPYVETPQHIAAMRAYLESNGVNVNEDNTVTLWHATTPEAAIAIAQEGYFKGGATAPGGMTGLALEPSAFFGANREWVAETWGRGLAEPIEVKVPVQYLRHGAQNFDEFYFEGGLRRGDDGVWRPEKLRSTFVDRIAQKRFGGEVDRFGARLETGAKALREAAGPDAPPIVARLIGEPAPPRAASEPVQPADVTAPPVAPESQAAAATEAAGTPGASAESSATAGRLAQIEAQFPDLMVRMDGDEQARPLAEFLAAVKAEADEMTADAPLMQVAAECALLNGA